jgi:hypothetical protein
MAGDLNKDPVPSFPITEPFFYRNRKGLIFLGGYLTEQPVLPGPARSAHEVQFELTPFDAPSRRIHYLDLYADPSNNRQNPRFIVQYGHGPGRERSWTREELTKTSVGEAQQARQNGPYFIAALHAWERWKTLEAFTQTHGPAALDPTAPYPRRFLNLRGPTIEVIQHLYEDLTGHPRAMVQAFHAPEEPTKWIVVVGRDFSPDHIWSGKEESRHQGLKNLLTVLSQRVKSKQTDAFSHLLQAQMWVGKRNLEYTQEEVIQEEDS